MQFVSEPLYFRFLRRHTALQKLKVVDQQLLRQFNLIQRRGGVNRRGGGGDGRLCGGGLPRGRDRLVLAGEIPPPRETKDEGDAKEHRDCYTSASQQARTNTWTKTATSFLDF